jgi:hypothetical protein
LAESESVAPVKGRAVRVLRANQENRVVTERATERVAEIF